MRLIGSSESCNLGSFPCIALPFLFRKGCVQCVPCREQSFHQVLSFDIDPPLVVTQFGAELAGEILCSKVPPPYAMCLPLLALNKAFRLYMLVVGEEFFYAF